MGNLAELFTWAVAQSEAAQPVPPLAIHTAQYARHQSGQKCSLCPNGVTCIHTRQIIRARPFTVAFEKYVDGEEEVAPITLALMDIHSDPTLRLEYEIAWAIVCGRHTDLDVLYAVLGRPQGFEAAARRALTLLRDKTLQTVQKRVSETGQRVQSAAEAAKARAEDRARVKKEKVVVA